MKHVDLTRPGFYMHAKALDVFIEVLHDGRYRWWNLGYTGQPWMLPRKVPYGDVSKLKPQGWVALSVEQMNTPRVKPGLPKGASVHGTQT